MKPNVNNSSPGLGLDCWVDTTHLRLRSLLTAKEQCVQVCFLPCFHPCFLASYFASLLFLASSCFLASYLACFLASFLAFFLSSVGAFTQNEHFPQDTTLATLNILGSSKQLNTMEIEQSSPAKHDIKKHRSPSEMHIILQEPAFAQPKCKTPRNTRIATTPQKKHST